MKKPVFALMFLVATALHVSAQGFYFDAGVNIGASITEVEGYNSSPLLWGWGFGLKAGFGPLGNVPIYVVGVTNGLYPEKKS